MDFEGEDEETMGFGTLNDEQDEDVLEWAPMDTPPFGKDTDGEMAFLMHGGLQSAKAGPIPTCMYSQKVQTQELRQCAQPLLLAR